ncbi:hypothetical protein B0J11DRAFT_560679 [Dendryphion nanum]|uniref:M protein, serotype 2.1 n=1 Tax=Dendryphion nanum TaxID=256645 RepID=A0A9P9DHG0_9PLEO|nr:hypothetical protein B0J11DRAFT_560679 [Dendryphion nanum]
MSSTTARKPATGTPTRDSTTKPSSSPGAASRTPARASTPTANGTNGVQRRQSVRSSVNGTPVSARAAVRKPGAPSTLGMNSSQADDNDDDAREEAAAYLQDLKERLQKAETDAEERQKQVDVLNSRLDEALKEQAKLEERAHEEEEKVEGLDNEKRELIRQQRELEGIYEAERAQAMKEKEETQAREDELQETIQRLKETMAMKNGPQPSSDGEDGHLSRASSFRNNPSRNSSSQNLDSTGSFAPPSSIQRSNSRNNSKLIHQKDKIIEGLRLELAELQIKLVQMENAGGGRMAELEKQLLETRMTNARLMEDNESFQLLLSEKTLNGDLTRGDFLRTTATPEERAPSRAGPSTSLADELESAEGNETEIIRRLEAEINAQKDQNKALTLYINKIIGRLLTHQGFESVLGNDLDEAGGAGAPNTNKELPPPPKENDQPQGFLQRAKSVAMGGGRAKPRPMSFAPAPALNEDPTTAPSIPLQRSSSTRTASGNYLHRRSTSEMPPPANPSNATTIINNMMRAPVPSGPQSPGLVSPRSSIFSIPSSRVPSSGAPIHEEREDSVSVSENASSTDTPSPPRRVETTNAGAGGVMTGKQMRPLRLVQNEEEAMRARKAANRGSWMTGWFGGEKEGGQQ